MEIFLQMGLDRQFTKQPVGQMACPPQLRSKGEDAAFISFAPTHGKIANTLSRLTRGLEADRPASVIHRDMLSLWHVLVEAGP
jgi:hypothetical protein